jgi:hypothetical protein
MKRYRGILGNRKLERGEGMRSARTLIRAKTIQSHMSITIKKTHSPGARISEAA